MLHALPPPGTHAFLPSLLAHVRAATPAFPLEPILLQVLLLSLVAGNRNLVLRTREEDVPLVAKLASLTLSTIFGYNTHRLKCHSKSASQTPSEFLRTLFFPGSTTAPSADINPSASSHKLRHRRVSNSRNSVGKLPIAASASTGTVRSRRTSITRSTSHPSESRPSTTHGRSQLDPTDTDLKPSIHAEAHSHPNYFLPTGAQTDMSVPTLASSIGSHFRNVSRGSTEALKLASVVVVSGLELANLPCQKAVLRTLAERKLILSDGGLFGHDREGLSLELPDDFFLVYVCRFDPRERPPIHKSLLDKFAMSSSVDVSAQTRLLFRQFRPPSSPSTTSSTPHTSFASAAFPTSQLLGSSAGPLTPLVQPPASPIIPCTLIKQLKHLCATQTYIRPPLDIYLADLFSATRQYGPLDAMMLTVRARQDAEHLVRASRVLGTDQTGAELIKERAELFLETDDASVYPHSHSSVASSSSDGLLDAADDPEPLGGSNLSIRNSLASEAEQLVELDVSEVDIARIFPRVVSHRIRVRGSPFDEIMSSAVCGAIGAPGNESQNEDMIRWERETIKDILVHILAEV